MSRRARNPSQPLTLGLFERTGRQDCGNAFDANDFNEVIRKDRKAGKIRTARQIVDDTWKEWEAGGEFEQQWLEQQSGDFESLDPHACFEAWAQGWRACAVRQVQDLLYEMEEREREEREDNPMHRKNPHAHELESEITEGIARALWVTAYADWVRNLPAAQKRELGAGPGEDWTDVAPENPRTAYDAAAQLERLFAQANAGAAMVDLLADAMEADGKKSAGFAYAHRFGHYMAMQALDHGVSWFDDHAQFAVNFPGFEAMTGDGESVDWSPMSIANPRSSSRRKTGR